MGSRAVTTWLDDRGRTLVRLYQHWASPCFQLPLLATWLHETEHPSAQSYLTAAYRETDPLDMPREPFPTTGPLPGDLDNLYTLQVRFNPVRLYVKAQYREMGHSSEADRWKLAHEGEDARGLYLAAAYESEQMAKRTRQILERSPGSTSHMPDPDELERNAAEFRQWAEEV